MVDIQNRYLSVSIDIATVKCRSTAVTLHDGLQIFLLRQRWDEVVELPLLRMEAAIELIESLRPLGRVACLTGEHLVMDALDGIAFAAFRLDME